MSSDVAMCLAGAFAFLAACGSTVASQPSSDASPAPRKPEAGMAARRLDASTTDGSTESRKNEAGSTDAEARRDGGTPEGDGSTPFDASGDGPSRPPPGPSTCVYQGPATPLMSDCAADMVGVNTHINYLGTIYDTGFSTIIEPSLRMLGVRHIRDNPGGGTDITTPSRYAELAAEGIHLLLINSDDTDEAYAHALNTDAGTMVVEAVEPPNEQDDALPSLVSFIPAMWVSYRDDPTMAQTTILGPSFADTRDSPGLLAAMFPDASAYMNDGNMHDYCGENPEGAFGGGWGITLDAAISEYRLLSKPDGIWVSENGYQMSGSVPGQSAVTQRAAAKYLPRQFLTHLLNGIPRFYVYQLINDTQDFGILDVDGSPRLQYTAIQNFISLLADPGPTFFPQTLEYTLSGDLTNIYSIVLQKRDGRFYLIVWQGVLSSVVATSDSQIADVEATPRSLTLDLTTPITHANQYTPSFDSTAINESDDANGITSLSLSVLDYLLVVELEP